MNNTKSTITTKNINRQGAGVLTSSFGDTKVSVVKNGSLYYAYVEERNTGMNKLDAASSWNELCEYLTCTLVEDKDFGKAKKKSKRKTKGESQ